jgi:hypothetical protein
MPSIQTAYNLKRAQDGTRAAQWINPKQGELLIRTREQAYAQISAFERQLEEKLPKHKQAELLIARAMVYEATGDPKMVEVALDAWNCTKTSTTAHMMAVGYHHIGDIKRACEYYEKAYRYPHEAGFNVDLAYTQALLFQGKWSEAHKQTLKLKKRMVYAAYLPEWDGQPCKELSLISEGGFGDIIHTGRWIPALTKMGINLTIYLPPMFFESGFVDLLSRQHWAPEVKLLTETPQTTLAVGFFDLPAKFNVQPNTIPAPLEFKADPALSEKYRNVRTGTFPNADIPTIGLCWAASASETPLCPRGIYRSLTEQQVDSIVRSALGNVRFVNLQKDLKMDELTGIVRPEIRTWSDTAAIIANLDAVISVDTAVAHLAASMGKPVLMPLSGALDWKYALGETDTAWYPTMRLFKNNGFGFNNAVSNLNEYIKNGKLHNDLGFGSRVRQELS